MRSSKIIKALICLSLMCALLASSRGEVSARAMMGEAHNGETVSPGKHEGAEANSSIQTQGGGTAQGTTTIIVGGRTLAGPNSSAQYRTGRLLLPVSSIARALGDTLGVDAPSHTVFVRRQTGVSADFSAQLNQVRENGSVVLTVSNTADLIFSPNAEELMLPVEIVAALLDASIRLDESARAISITRGQEQAETVRAGARRASWELYRIDYDYNFNRYGSALSQNLTLYANGRMGDGRFTLATNLDGGTAQARLGLLRNGTLTFERPNGQKFIGGDFGTGTDLQFMSSNVRGAWAQLPVGSVRLNVFAGRTISGVFSQTITELLNTGLPEQSELQQASPLQTRLQYDTNIFGVYATTDSSINNSSRPDPLTLSAGLLHFKGLNRSGEILTGSLRYTTRRSRVQGDVGVGKFDGAGRDGVRVEGLGGAADLSGSFQLRENLNVQGRYAFTSANFLSPQAGLHDPLKLMAGGITWQPRQWLTTSLSGSAATRPGDSRQRERFFTATLNVTPRSSSLPTMFFSHTQSNTPQVRAAAFTLLSAAKSFSRWRLFMNATRIKTIGPASINAQFGSSLRINESNSLELSQSFGSRGSLSGTADWQLSNFFQKRLNLNAGFGYTRNSNSSMTTQGRLNASLRLPRESTLQISYLQTQTGPTLLINLRGSLLRKQRAEAALGAPIAEMNSYGAFSGRVYQDVNLNGRFDPGVDRPQADVKVRVDGNRYVVSDANGLFRIDGVRVGEHQVYLDLLSVRADLTLLDGAQQEATLLPDRDSIVDFRLVRTGRITGVVWLDLNGNARLDDGEQPLSDVRIVTGSGRDTLTDVNGFFVLADLPPGGHAILVDEKTLPENTKSALGSLSVKVLAGSETGDTNFPITPIPPEIKRFNGK
ncbi:MAG: hypothetical protein WCB68_24310 [Pyrinomonadaceae bacterium]